VKKIFVIVYVFVLACQMFAVVVDVPKISVSRFADGESSRDQSFQSSLTNRARTFKIEMSFNASMTNNVQIAFGMDSVHEDGKLAAEETEIILGWDCGKWFLRPRGLRTRYNFAVTNFVAGKRILKASIEIYPSGEPKAITFQDNGSTFSFSDFKLKDNSWLKPDDWSLLRVTTRGADIADEDVSIKFTNDSTLIIIQ
jgi:hypothetical protein